MNKALVPYVDKAPVPFVQNGTSKNRSTAISCFARYMAILTAVVVVACGLVFIIAFCRENVPVLLNWLLFDLQFWPSHLVMIAITLFGLILAGSISCLSREHELSLIISSFLFLVVLIIFMVLSFNLTDAFQAPSIQIEWTTLQDTLHQLIAIVSWVAILILLGLVLAAVQLLKG